ncbi:MAG: Calcineurin subunit B [Amphiamblys sp. WSBS2006]|nr:MAG: Calcineurin subunit B [Amphiamblys sp. WSBS2006]
MKKVFYGMGKAVLEQIQEVAGIGEGETAKMYTRFCELDRDGDGLLSKKDLLGIPELFTNPLGERIADVFLRVRGLFGFGTDKKEGVDFAGFLLGVFLPSVSPEHNAVFLFGVFDADDDGVISKEDFLGTVEQCGQDRAVCEDICREVFGGEEELVRSVFCADEDILCLFG